ncbi:late embryogenesis abundant protein, partial [Musa troglodytarum]
VEFDRQGEGVRGGEDSADAEAGGLLASVSIRSFTRDSVLFHSEVAVLNPYSHSIPICQLSYALKSAGREVASGTMPDPGSLPASAETKLEVSVKVPYDFLISLMRDIGRDRDIDDEMQVGLTIDLPIIGDFTIPLSTKGEIKLPTSPTSSAAAAAEEMSKQASHFCVFHLVNGIKKMEVNSKNVLFLVHSYQI